MALELYRRKQQEQLDNKQVDSINEEIITYTGYISKNGSGHVKLRNIFIDQGSVLIQDDNSGDHTRITFLEECNFVGTWAGGFSGQDSNIAIELYNSSDTQILRASDDAGLTASGATGFTGKANAGDYLIVFVGGPLTPNDSVITNFSVKANKIEKKTIESL